MVTMCPRLVVAVPEHRGERVDLPEPVPDRIITSRACSADTSFRIGQLELLEVGILR